MFSLIYFEHETYIVLFTIHQKKSKLTSKDANVRYTWRESFCQWYFKTLLFILWAALLLVPKSWEKATSESSHIFSSIHSLCWLRKSLETSKCKSLDQILMTSILPTVTPSVLLYFSVACLVLSSWHTLEHNNFSNRHMLISFTNFSLFSSDYPALDSSVHMCSIYAIILYLFTH